MIDYQPLNASKNEIRLLWIEPPRLSASNSRETIHCSLKKVSLDEYGATTLAFRKSANLQTLTGADYWNAKLEEHQGKNHEDYRAAIKDVLSDPNFGRWIWGDFVALSYTWGNLDHTRDIMVNGKRVGVGENLEEYLQFMRMDPDNRARVGIWVDALCINQNDVKERNVEVRRMADIYRGASSVIAWLGKEADESPKAIRLLNIIANCNFGSLDEWNSFMVDFHANEHFFEVGSW